MSEGDVTKKTEKLPVAAGSRGLMLRSLDDMWRFAKYVQASGLAPYSFKTPEAILIAVQGGAELGFTPMQSLQSLVVVKGKIGMYVETARALVESSPECEWVRDNMNELSGIIEWKDDAAATVEAKRRNRPEAIKRSFSVADAKRAGLWGKTGKQSGEPSAWVTYPGRMLYARALGFCLRDGFPDVVKGIRTSEELQDLPDERPHAATLQSGTMIDGDALETVADQIDEEDGIEALDGAGENSDAQQA